MLFDAAFWVAFAFCLFVVFAFKPGLRALLDGLDRYRLTIRSQIENTQTGLQEAHLALKKALDAEARITQQIDDIKTHTEIQLNLHQKETDRQLEDLKIKAAESLGNRLILLENTFQKTVHQRLLSETISYVRRTLSVSPLGQSTSFTDDLSSGS